MLQGSPLELLRSQKLTYDIFPSCQFACPSSPWKRRDLPCCQSEQLELKETAMLTGLWLQLTVFPCKGLRTCSSTLPAGCSHHQSTRASRGEDTHTTPCCAPGLHRLQHLILPTEHRGITRWQHPLNSHHGRTARLAIPHMPYCLPPPRWWGFMKQSISHAVLLVGAVGSIPPCPRQGMASAGTGKERKGLLSLLYSAGMLSTLLPLPDMGHRHWSFHRGRWRCPTAGDRTVLWASPGSSGGSHCVVPDTELGEQVGWTAFRRLHQLVRTRENAA